MLTQAEARELVAGLSGGPAGGAGMPRAAAVGASAHMPSLLADYAVTRAILDGASAGIAVLDPDLRYLYANDTLAVLNGVPATDHIGKTVCDLLPDFDLEPVAAALRAVLTDGNPQVLTVSGRTCADPTEDRWWVCAYDRLEDPSGTVLGVVAIMLETAETHRVQQLLERARTRLALLDEAATRIGTSLDVEHTCRELARLLVPRLADLAAVDVLDAAGAPPADGPLRLRRVALAANAHLADAADFVCATGTIRQPRAVSAAARCMAEQRPVICDPAEREGASDDPDRDCCSGLGTHSAMVVPLIAHHSPVGAVSLVRVAGSPAFRQEDVDLVADLARRASASIDNAERYTHEHQTALALQQALLTEPRPPHADVECAARYLPTGSDIEIGGDWYDTVPLPCGKTLLAVGDVMGHGLEAAASMSEYRSLLRTLALQSDRPEAILAEAQRIVAALSFERVATCIVAVVDPLAHTCSIASAGHMPPLLVRPDGARELLDVPVDPPLGVGESCRYAGAEVAFDPGSVLLCYTDGLVERRGEDIESCLARLAGVELDPAGSLAQLIDAVLDRCFDPAASEDDVAVLAARLLPQA
jgi:hypothetical protein